VESVDNVDQKLKKKTDKEHFDKWDYISIDAVEEEMAVSDRVSKIGGGRGGGMKMSVSEGDMAASYMMAPSPHRQQYER
jgi:hypothetical protein